MNQKEELIRITLLGDTGSGKSSLLSQLTNSNQKLKPTIGIEIFSLSIQDKSIQITDTAGKEIICPDAFSLERENAIGIVVDSSQKLNNENFIKWLNLIKTQSSSNTLVFILINKNDLLAGDNNLLGSIQSIAKQEGIKISLMASCSAKTGNGITEVFENVAKRIINGYQEREDTYPFPVIEENFNQKQNTFSLFNLLEDLLPKISQHKLLAINLFMLVVTLILIALATYPPVGAFLALGFLFPGAGELVAAAFGVTVILFVNLGIALASYIMDKRDPQISTTMDNPTHTTNHSNPDSENLLLLPGNNPPLLHQAETRKKTETVSNSFVRFLHSL